MPPWDSVEFQIVVYLCFITAMAGGGGASIPYSGHAYLGAEGVHRWLRGGRGETPAAPTSSIKPGDRASPSLVKDVEEEEAVPNAGMKADNNPTNSEGRGIRWEGIGQGQQPKEEEEKKARRQGRSKCRLEGCRKQAFYGMEKGVSLRCSEHRCAEGQDLAPPDPSQANDT